MKFSNENFQFLDTLNAALEAEPELDELNELHDSGEWVFEYRDGMLYQIGYFPSRDINDPIPVWTYQNGRRTVIGLPVNEFYESQFDFANFASADWFK